VIFCRCMMYHNRAQWGASEKTGLNRRDKDRTNEGNHELARL
jgi:hypothetical protein